MKTWYVMEVSNVNSKREYSAKIKTDSLTQAKRLASKAQYFQGTILYLGTSTDEHSFVEDIVAYKENGKWHDVK